jgi:Lipocalin-like domain
MRSMMRAALLLSSIAVAQTAKAPAPNPAFRPFVGTWRLVSSVEVLPDGTARPYGFGPHPQGYLMYDATGHVCAQVVNPDRPQWIDPEHPTPQEVKTAFDGFAGYCGTFTVDEKSHTAAHIPEVSFDPNLVAQPTPRSYRFESNKLIYSGTEKREPSGESNWTMIWEKVK